MSATSMQSVRGRKELALMASQGFIKLVDRKVIPVKKSFLYKNRLHLVQWSSNEFVVNRVIHM